MKLYIVTTKKLNTEIIYNRKKYMGIQSYVYINNYRSKFHLKYTVYFFVIQHTVIHDVYYKTSYQDKN